MTISYKKLSDKAIGIHKSRLSDAGIDFFLSRPIEWGDRGGIHIGLARTDIAIEIPQGFVAITAPRSSMLFNNNIAVFTSIIDSGYTGEITFLLHYLGGGNPPDIEVGTKIAQIVFMDIPMVSTNFIEVNELPEWSDRKNKGFGSTGDGK